MNPSSSPNPKPAAAEPRPQAETPDKPDQLKLPVRLGTDQTLQGQLNSALAELEKAKSEAKAEVINQKINSERGRIQKGSAELSKDINALEKEKTKLITEKADLLKKDFALQQLEKLRDLRIKVLEELKKTPNSPLSEELRTELRRELPSLKNDFSLTKIDHAMGLKKDLLHKSPTDKKLSDIEEKLEKAKKILIAKQAELEVNNQQLGQLEKTISDAAQERLQLKQQVVDQLRAELALKLRSTSDRTPNVITQLQPESIPAEVQYILRPGSRRADDLWKPAGAIKYVQTEAGHIKFYAYQDNNTKSTRILWTYADRNEWRSVTRDGNSLRVDDPRVFEINEGQGSRPLSINVKVPAAANVLPTPLSKTPVKMDKAIESLPGPPSRSSVSPGNTGNGRGQGAGSGQVLGQRPPGSSYVETPQNRLPKSPKEDVPIIQGKVVADPKRDLTLYIGALDYNLNNKNRPDNYKDTNYQYRHLLTGSADLMKMFPEELGVKVSPDGKRQPGKITQTMLDILGPNGLRGLLDAEREYNNFGMTHLIKSRQYLTQQDQALRNQLNLANSQLPRLNDQILAIERNPRFQPAITTVGPRTQADSVLINQYQVLLQQREALHDVFRQANLLQTAQLIDQRDQIRQEAQVKGELEFLKGEASRATKISERRSFVIKNLVKLRDQVEQLKEDFEIKEKANTPEKKAALKLEHGLDSVIKDIDAQLNLFQGRPQRR